MNALLIVKAWFAKYGWYVVAGGLIVVSAVILLGKKRGKVDVAPIEKAVALAIAQAEAAHVEVKVRKQVAGEKAGEQLKELAAAKKEPDPVERRKKLSAMLTSFGS